VRKTFPFLLYTEIAGVTGMSDGSKTGAAIWQLMIELNSFIDRLR
jgi:hypothetical protein